MASTMAAQSSGLDADQVRVVQQGIATLLAAGFEHKTVGELAQTFNVKQPATGTWRNIRYGEKESKRLAIMEKPSRRSRQVGGLPLGARFDVLDMRKEKDEVWLMLMEDKWVLAKTADVVNCVDTRVWKDSNGAVPQEAFAGQAFPHDGMFTEGYAGSGNICLVSASGDGLWREINIEMLFRDIATATVFEKQWGGGANFTTWVAYYGANVVLFAEVRTLSPKIFVVTVKPSPRWRRYVAGVCTGPILDDIRDDIGVAQFEECSWLHSNRTRLELSWQSVIFITPFTFLREHCRWSLADCQHHAEQNLRRLLDAWDLMDCDKRTYQFAVSYWLLDEAFAIQELSLLAGTMLSKILLSKGFMVSPLDGAAAQAWQKLLDSPSVLGPSVIAALAEPGDAGNRALLKLLRLGQGAAPIVGPIARAPRHAEERVRSAVAEFLDEHGASISSAPNTSMTSGPQGGHQDQAGAGQKGMLYALFAPLRGSRWGTSCGHGTWQKLPDMPNRKSSLAAVASEGYVYVLGGFNGGHKLADALRFDPSAGGWEALAPLPSARVGLAAAALGGKVYALGGWDGGPLADALRFDPSAGGWEALAPMPSGRFRLAAAALGGKVYALGGFDGGKLADALRFDPSAGGWEALAPLPSGRFRLAAAALGGKVYALGGYDGRGHKLADALRFDPSAGGWEALAPLPSSGRDDLAAAALGGKVYVLGGYDNGGNALATVERFDPEAMA